MRMTRRTRGVSQNCSSVLREHKSQIKSSSRGTDGDSDFSAVSMTDAYKPVSAFVSLSRIVTRKSSSSDIDCNNIANPHGGKTRKKGEKTSGVDTNVKGCLHDKSKQNATSTKSTTGSIVSKVHTRTRQHTRSKKLSSQPQQMDPKIEVSTTTVSSQSDDKDSIEGSDDVPVSQCLRPRNQSASDNSSKKASKALIGTNACSFKSNRSRLKSQRKDAAEEDRITSPVASDKSNTDSSITSEMDGTTIARSLDGPIQSAGEFVSSRRRRTAVPSDANSTSSIILEKVSVSTESFYSKKSRKPPCLRSWLQSAERGKSSTPIASVSRPSRTNSLYQKDVVSDKNHIAKVTTKRKAYISQQPSSEKSSNSGAEDSQDTASGSLTDNGSGVKTWLKTARNSKVSSTFKPHEFQSNYGMKAANSKTPASRATRSALKHVNSSTPHLIQQKKNEVEYLFGFENLLEPAATLLQDVSPIPQPPLPKRSRKRKEQRLKALKQKRIEAQLSSAAPGVAGTAANRHYVYDIIEDEDTENPIQLFEVAPITPYSPFKIKEVTTTSSKPEKPAKNTQSISNAAKVSLPFELEEALPWRDIMEHELVIESA